MVSNPGPFDQRSSDLTTQPSPPLVILRDTISISTVEGYQPNCEGTFMSRIILLKKYAQLDPRLHGEVDFQPLPEIFH